MAKGAMACLSACAGPGGQDTRGPGGRRARDTFPGPLKATDQGPGRHRVLQPGARARPAPFGNMMECKWLVSIDKSGRRPERRHPGTWRGKRGRRPPARHAREGGGDTPGGYAIRDATDDGQSRPE